MPADLFRTHEDASGTDLDWFWRGWFYSTDHCDIAIRDVSLFAIDTGDPEVQSALAKQERDEEPETLAEMRNKPLPKLVDQKPELKDFYNEYDELEVTESQRRAFERFLNGLTDKEKEILSLESNFYVVDFENLGGLVMPIIVELQFEDGTSEEVRIPAEIWRRNNEQVSKLFLTEKKVAAIVLDPHLETADIDLDNNRWPPRAVPTRFELFKFGGRGGDNPMRRAQREDEQNADDEEADDSDPESDDN